MDRGDGEVIVCSRILMIILSMSYGDSLCTLYIHIYNSHYIYNSQYIQFTVYIYIIYIIYTIHYTHTHTYGSHVVSQMENRFLITTTKKTIGAFEPPVYQSVYV